MRIGNRFAAALGLFAMSGCAVDVAPADEGEVPELASANDTMDDEIVALHDPCASFFVDRADRREYAIALTEDVCAIDLLALDQAEMRWSHESPVAIIGGSAYQLLESPTGDEAIVASYRLAAMDAGLLETCDRPDQQEFATLVASAALKCARSATCRSAVVNAAKAIAASVTASAIWDGIKKLFD